MSSNGKSSDGGGGEDADDEDGVNKNIKSGISNIPKSFEQRSAIHPHMPAMIPSQTRQQRPINPLPTSIPSSQIGPRSSTNPLGHFPPTISIPSPPHQSVQPSHIPSAPAPNYYRQPVPHHQSHADPSYIQSGPSVQQYSAPQAPSYHTPGGTAYTSISNQQQHRMPPYQAIPAPTQPRMLSNPAAHQPQTMPASRYPTSHTHIHGPNQNLLNPSASSSFTYAPQQQPQTNITSPQQANQGLLNPQLPPTQGSAPFPYGQQPAQYSTQTQNIPHQNMTSKVNAGPTATSFYPAQMQQAPISNLSHAQPQIPHQLPPTGSLSSLPPSAPQGSFFNPAAAAFSKAQQVDSTPPVLHSHYSDASASNPPSTISNSPAPGSNRILELQNELLIKKKKEMWKYKRKKKKKGEGTGTGTEDSQDSQEDSGSVNSGSESATGSHSSSSTPLPQNPSIVVQQHRGLDTTSNSPVSAVNIGNTSAILNKPSITNASQGIGSHQYYRPPTPNNPQLAGMHSNNRQIASTTVAGWYQQTNPTSQRPNNPAMISSGTQRHEYYPQRGHFSSAQYQGNYASIPMHNNSTQRLSSPYNIYNHPQSGASYPNQQIVSQPVGATMNPRPELRVQSNMYPRHQVAGHSHPHSTGSHGQLAPQYHQRGIVPNPTNVAMRSQFPANEPTRYSNTGHVASYPRHMAQAQNPQYFHTRPYNGNGMQPMGPGIKEEPIKTEPVSRCQKEHTYGLCDLCGYCGPPPPATSSTQSISNGSKCSKKHGIGLCFECGYVGPGSSTIEGESQNVIKPFVPKTTEPWDMDDSSENSDTPDRLASFNQHKKQLGSVKSHAELVAALTKKKGRPRKQPIKDKIQEPKPELLSYSNDANVEATILYQNVKKPPKRPISLSMVKFHKSATNELNSEFDELLAELDYMEKTNKMHTTVFRTYGAKGVFDKTGGKIQVPVAPVPTLKKSLVESVKTANKKVDEKDSDFTASDDENDDSSEFFTAEEEEEEEEDNEEGSSEDEPIMTKRKVISTSKGIKKNKYEDDSDYDVSKEDLKMMKSLKRSTARLENPDYESEEESELSEPEDDKDEDWANDDLSDDEVPLRKRNIKERKSFSKQNKPRKIRGEDLSIDMNIDYQVSSSRSASGSRRRPEKTKRNKHHKIKRRKFIIESDEEDDSDAPLIKRNKKLKSRKCREESSDEYSASDTEKSSSSSETDIRKKNIVKSSEKATTNKELKTAEPLGDNEANSTTKKGNDDGVESDGAKTFDEYEEESKRTKERKRRRRIHRRQREQGYQNEKLMIPKSSSQCNQKLFVCRMRYRCRPFLKRCILRSFKGLNTKLNNRQHIFSDWKTAERYPKVILRKLSADDISSLTKNEKSEIDNANIKKQSSSTNGDKLNGVGPQFNKNRVRRILESSSDESFVSFRNESETDSNDVNEKPIDNKAIRALSFSEASSSNDVPQRSRSPKRKGSTARRNQSNQVRLTTATVDFPHRNGHDDGDESERSVQEARSPKRSSKNGSKANHVPNVHQNQEETLDYPLASNSNIHIKRGSAKRGKPEPITPQKTPEEEENLPWLLRDSNSTKKKCRIERALEDAYDKNPFPTMDELSELEAITNMSTKKIIYWFQQTRKTKSREEKLKELIKIERAFMKKQNQQNGYQIESVNNQGKVKKQLLKSSSSQSLYSVAGYDSESSGDFRGFESDSNQAGRRKIDFSSFQDSDDDGNQVVTLENFVPYTPSKRELSKPVVLYSTRYRDLFSRFCDTQIGSNGGTSIGKMKQLPSLSQLLKKCSAHLRNGIFQLDYVTPAQLEAVRNFIWGDNEVTESRVRIILVHHAM